MASSKPVITTSVLKKEHQSTMTTAVVSRWPRLPRTGNQPVLQPTLGQLRIPRNRVFFAGTKDKRAVTSQLFVIDAPMNKVAEVELPDRKSKFFGRTHQKIGFGNHRGNRFTIVVRGCCHPDGTPMTDDEAMAEVEPRTTWKPHWADSDSPTGSDRSDLAQAVGHPHAGRHWSTKIGNRP